jgi:DNA-binding response OmpR family regulator
MLNLFKKNKKTNILIVEDDPDTLLLLIKILKCPNIKVYTSNTGVDVINIIKTKKIDLAIVDYKLPYKNGILITNEIKMIKDIPIILETGERMLYENPEMLRDFQFDDVISKPFNSEDVFKVLDKYFN